MEYPLYRNLTYLWAYAWPPSRSKEYFSVHDQTIAYPTDLFSEILDELYPQKILLLPKYQAPTFMGFIISK